MILGSKIIWICFCFCFEIFTLGSSKYYRQGWWTTLKAKLLDLMSNILPKNEKKSLPQFLCTVFHNLYYWLCCDGDSNLLQALFPPISLPLSCQVLTYVPYFLATIHYQSKTYRLTELIVTPLLPPNSLFF